MASELKNELDPLELDAPPVLNLPRPIDNIDGSTNLPTIIKEKPLARVYTNEKDTKEDFTYSRETLTDLIDKGKTALDSLLNISIKSEHPRAFEVTAKMMETIGGLADQLIELQKKMRELEFMEEVQKEQPPANTSVNNIIVQGDLVNHKTEQPVFNGTTTQLFEQVADDDEEGQIIDVTAETVIFKDNDIPIANVV